jgi:hypothetical protein
MWQPEVLQWRFIRNSSPFVLIGCISAASRRKEGEVSKQEQHKIAYLKGTSIRPRF